VKAEEEDHDDDGGGGGDRDKMSNKRIKDRER
jgi:hypothetical protein